MSDGIHLKYNVSRVDGSSMAGGKHAQCAYFVLDLDHDEYAVPALLAYAKACRPSNPQLADDICRVLASTPTRCSCREASCPHSLAAAFSGHGQEAHRMMRRKP